MKLVSQITTKEEFHDAMVFKNMLRDFKGPIKITNFELRREPIQVLGLFDVVDIDIDDLNVEMVIEVKSLSEAELEPTIKKYPKEDYIDKSREFKVLRAVKGSPGDPVESISYYVSHVQKAFPNMKFDLGASYIFTHKGGQKILMKRNVDRFYSGKLYGTIDGIAFAVDNQNHVFHEISSVEAATRMGKDF